MEERNNLSISLSHYQGTQLEKSFIEDDLEKAVYKDNEENRRLGRVGREYGKSSGSELQGKLDSAKQKRDSDNAFKKQFKLGDTLTVKDITGEDVTYKIVEAYENDKYKLITQHKTGKQSSVTLSGNDIQALQDEYVKGDSNDIGEDKFDMKKAGRGAPVGTINSYNEIKMPDGTWKWVSKKMRESGEIEKLQNYGKPQPTAPVEDRAGRIPSTPGQPIKLVSGKNKWGETDHVASVGEFGTKDYLSVLGNGIGTRGIVESIARYAVEDRDFGDTFSIKEGDIDQGMTITSNGNDFYVSQAKPGRLLVNRIQSSNEK